MASKFQFITELYDKTVLEITSNPKKWTDFLRAASFNYKCSFDEQVLIYAQRPDATAVLELEKWNRQFGRWINKGATGIAVFDEQSGHGRLKHYFDVADTHQSRISNLLPIWKMKERFEAEVIEALENTYGYLAEKDTLADAIFSASRNAVADNMPDYLRDLQSCREDSFLEELDKFNVEVEYRKTLEASVAYMLMSRLSLDADYYITREDFINVTEFNTPPTVNALGIATSDIAEMGLRELARTVMNLQKAQFFANDGKVPYDNPKEEITGDDERSFEHGADLQNAGRLQGAQSLTAAGAEHDAGQIRNFAAQLSQAAPPRAVHQFENDLPSDGAFGGNRAAGDVDGGADDSTDGENRGRDGADESERPDALGRADEQFPTFSGGNSAERTDLQLKPQEPEPNTTGNWLVEWESDESGGDNELPPFLDAHLMEAIVLDEGGRTVKRQNIFEYFQSHKSYADRCAFLEKAYTETYVEFDADGTRIGYKKQKNGLLMWESHYLSRTSESVFSWGVVTELTEHLIEYGKYRIKLGLQSFPTVTEQLTLFDLGGSAPIYEMDNVTAQSLFPSSTVPQAVIDQALYTAGNEQNSLFRVTSFYLRERPEEENIAFLRREFGTNNGRGIELDGRKYAVWFTDEGIKLAEGDSVRTGRSRTIVIWEQASARILELLTEGCYLSQAELAAMPGKVLTEMADSIILTARDLDEKGKTQNLLPTVTATYAEHIGFPDCTNALAAQMQDEENLVKLAQEYRQFKSAYAADHGILRFHLYTYNTHRIEAVLDGVDYQRRTFTAQADFQRKCKMFITQDEIEQLFLGRGTAQYDESQLRTYSYFCYPHTLKEKADFLKDTHGIGGGTCNGYSTNHDSKGFKFTRSYARRDYDEVLLTWSKEAQIVDSLIAQKRFPNEDSLAAIPEYEIRQLAISVYHGFYNAPDEIVRPYPKGADYYQAVPLLQEQLSEPAKVGEILQTLTAALDTTAPDDRYYDSRRNAKKQLFDFAKGTFTLFNGKHQELTQSEQMQAPVEVPQAESLADETPENSDIPIGAKITVDGRQFEVEKVNFDADKVSLRDVTFENGVGFPISRIEPIAFVRSYFEEQQPTEKIPQDTLTVSAEKIKPPVPRKKVREPGFAPLSVEGFNFRITDDELGCGGQKAKYQMNVAAIRTLQTIEAENRLATPDEQEVLSRYVGWGGLPDVFDPEKSGWAEEYGALKALLSEDEYRMARESTLNAHYTGPIVIKAMYRTLENLGFNKGNILEPSCGIGNFFGLLPEKMAESKLYGVELDSVTGRIAQQLYPQSSIAIQGFETTEIPDSFFDVAIGNVPFGQYKVADKRYDKLNFSIHDYFFSKSLDKVRPGGVVAFLTSSYTMDKKSENVRKYLAQRADLLGAIRLPNTAFKANAGTEVVADILFLQKRDRMIDIEPDWVHTSKTADGYDINSYFMEHPDMVLGQLIEESTQYGHALTCVPYEGQDLGELLADAISNIHGEITDYIRDEELDEEDKSIPADPSVRNFSYTEVSGTIYYRENSRMYPVDVSITAENRIKGLIELRDCVHTLIDYQTEDYPDEDIRSQQHKLNALYDSFISKYDLISTRGNSMAFEQDSSYFLLCSLEVLDEDGKLERKADLFTKRTIRCHTPAERVDTATEALAVSIGEKARVDMDYMGRLTGKTEEELFSDLRGVVFLNPDYIESATEQYLPADEYLSGNVRQKLATATEKAKVDTRYAINSEALTRVQPAELTASEISVRLGATWLSPETVRQFTFALLGTPRYAQWNIKVHYSKLTSEWRIEGKSKDSGNVKATSTYGTKRINAYNIIEESLNLKDVRIFDYIEDADGHRQAVLNKKETAIAQSKQELIRAQFAEWVWKDPTRRETICEAYNILFNSNRPREYDGSHITLSGMNPEIVLRPHQINAIAHVIYGGNTLLAHCVGAGKTFEMVAAAMESKRLGLCQKSLFVVPNHLTEQWASEFLQLYPSANILVATKKDFETKNRKKFCGRIATGEYDAVIIGHSQFEKIPMSAERQRMIIEGQMDEILMGIDELKRSGGENFSIKQMEKTRKSLEIKLDKLNDQGRKDDVVTFEQLGVDRLFVDESHQFKNLFLYTKMRNVAGIAQTEAQKSSDLFMKCRYLDEITSGRGIVFATGTPISNSMVEMYTIQRYLQYSALQGQELQHFDAWASNYGETVTAIELSPEGSGYRAKTRFAKFYNLPELMATFKNVADIQTADMLDLPVPEVVRHNVALKPSEYQKKMVAGLAERAEQVRNREVDSNVDNMLLITNDGRKLALDQRLMNPMLPDDPSGKAAKCAENVFAIWQRTSEQKSAQMVFCDLSTPHYDGSFNVYDDIKSKLLMLGIPENEIAFIHDAKTEAQKKEMFARVRNGQIRVLMGSTARMGAGTNAQQRLIALHHVDCPWRPSDLQQREGRIIRQGNENPVVEIYSYVTENTFDAYLYQLVESKQKFISQIMTSKSPVRSAEDVDETALSYAEIKALATGNPYIKEKMNLDTDVTKLKLLKGSHLSQRYALEDKLIKFFPTQIAEHRERMAGYGADIQQIKDNTHPNTDVFSPMELAGTTYTEKKEAGAALLELCQSLLTPEAMQIGSYRGLGLELSFDSFAQEYRLTMVGQLRHTVALGTDVFGNLQRMDNALETLPVKEHSCRDKLEELQNQLETAKVEVQRPFPREDELRQKTARLEELNALLNMDGKEKDDAEKEEKLKDKECER